MRRLLLLSLVGTAGCMAPDFDELSTIRVAEAHIEDLAMGGMGMIGGGRTGNGQLVVTARSGDVFEVPVDVGSGSLGLLLDMTLLSFGRIHLTVPERGEPIRGNELFGTYRGSRESFVLLLGPEARHLQNDHGVRIDQVSGGFGVGIAVTAEWFTITPDLPEEPTTDTFRDTGRTDTATIATDTGATGDTGLPVETGDTGLPVETGDTGPEGDTGDTGRRWPPRPAERDRAPTQVDPVP